MKRCATCEAITRDDAEVCVRCNGTYFAKADVEVVDNRYALDHRLGVGAMGVVFLAHDVDLGRTVALKLVAKTLSSSPRDAIRREAAALAAIRHLHVVQVFDFGAHGDSYFFAMEHVRGRGVDELLGDFRAHQAFVPIHRALTIAIQIAGGLAAAHAAGILHRDVKPSNVVIERASGRPVLVDFGLAHHVSTGVPRDFVGTPLYMAPEQWLGIPAGPAADVYGLACTLFELLTNRAPFVAATNEELFRMHSLDAPPALSSLRPELAPLDGILARALAKNAETRTPSCAHFRLALEEAGAPWLAKADATVTTDRPPSSTGSDHSEISDAVRILVVDDDPDFRNFAKRAVQLSMIGAYVSISIAASGKEAIASAQRKPPRLVLLDYDMADLDGLATLSALRALPRGDEARVIVVSGRTKDEERWRFALLGVEDFVDKPVQLPALVGMLSEIAGRNGWVRPDNGSPPTAEPDG
jgi:eukaryotic-like serine/threonine-protein kinase